MLVNISRDTAAEHRKLLLAGVAMVVVIVLLIGLSVAVYQKVFKSVVMVTVQAGNAGLQLAEFGDVRINGVLVGQVRDIEQTGDEAVIQLALEPDEADSIPANVNVEILPTTLFGQKYISLSAPEDASEESIAEGDVIPSDRVSTAVELNRVLNQLFPLLRAVRPVDLNQTLSALATALNGRGAEIGRSLDNLDSYLTTINEHIPAFEEDIRLLADVAETYDMAIPDFVRLLRNTTVTSRTVLEKQQQLSAFFQDVAGVSDTASRVLGANEDSLIRFGQVTRPVLRVLDVYAPEYPCLLKGVARYEGRLAEVFSGDRVKQYIEIGAAQRRAYNRSDQPVYGEVGHGPWCLGLPNPPVPIGPQPLNDGSNIDSQPGNSFAPGGDEGGPNFDPSSFDTSSGYAGTAAEQAVVNALLADQSGQSVAEIPPVATLLYGPLVRGTEVSG